MSDEYINTDDTMSPMYSEQSSVLLVVNLAQQPVELRDGIIKLISYAPHNNIVTENAMDDNESNEYKWHVK